MSKSLFASLNFVLAVQAAICRGCSANLISDVPNIDQLGELDGTEIKSENIIEWPRKPGERFAKKLECYKDYQLTYKDKYVACCLPGQKLLGSFDTVWECCGEGHEIAGSKATGYTCCPTGQIFDGKDCKPNTPVTPPTPEMPETTTCPNGKTPVGGKCVCPMGTTEASDGTCQPEGCTSGLTTGKSISAD